MGLTVTAFSRYASNRFQAAKEDLRLHASGASSAGVMWRYQPWKWRTTRHDTGLPAARYTA
jgi:hypothetical protein